MPDCEKKGMRLRHQMGDGDYAMKPEQGDVTRMDRGERRGENEHGKESFYGSRKVSGRGVGGREKRVTYK